MKVLAMMCGTALRRCLMKQRGVLPRRSQKSPIRDRAGEKPNNVHLSLSPTIATSHSRDL